MCCVVPVWDTRARSGESWWGGTCVVGPCAVHVMCLCATMGARWLPCAAAAGAGCVVCVCARAPMRLAVAGVRAGDAVPNMSVARGWRSRRGHVRRPPRVARAADVRIDVRTLWMAVAVLGVCVCARARACVCAAKLCLVFGVLLAVCEGTRCVLQLCCLSG